MADVPRGSETWPVPGTLSALLKDLAHPQTVAPETLPLTPAPGARIGRFEVVRAIGRGGFGVLLEAQDAMLGRRVALKLVRPGKWADQPDKPAVEEAEAVARLSHPNILQLHDVGLSDYGPYLVFELLHGEPLSARLERGTLPPPEAARVALEVAKALAHAHEASVVHRDMKPSNVFLCLDGQVKVLDFGLALVFGRRRTIDGGTPGWMAPEQRRGAPEDERTDVWAVGAMLLRSLSGRDPGTVRLEIPDSPDLAALIERLLADDPVMRPRDGAAVVELLTPIVRRLESAASSSEVRVRRAAGVLHSRHRRTWILAFTAAGLVGASTAAFVAWNRHVAAGGGVEARAAASGTSSLEAYQHYLRGIELRMRDCDFIAAEKEERQALALDPDFGAAHLQLGLLLLYGRTSLEDANAHFRAARTAVDRMPDREKRIIELDRFTTSSLPRPDPRADEPIASKGFDELVAAYPNDSYALYFAGAGHSFFGHWDRAVALYQRSLEVEPGQCYVTSVLIIALHRTGRGTETVRVARHAVSVRPNADNLASLANALVRNGQPEEAIQRARESLSAPHRTGETTVSAAHALINAGRPEEAEVIARELARDGPTERTRFEAGRLLALSLASQGKVHDALEAWPGDEVRNTPFVDSRASLLGVGHPRLDAPETVARLQNVTGPILLAGELAFFGDQSRADRLASALAPGSVAYEHHRAVALAQRGRWGEAVPALRKLMLRFGQKEAPMGVADARTEYQIEIRVLLGEGLLVIGEPGGALEMMRSADEFGAASLDGVGNMPRIRILRARALEQLGRRDEAAALLDEQLRLWRGADAGLPLAYEATAMRQRLGVARGPEAAAASGR